ncbi:hypothetical protein M514_00760 [Trichuris suis]|uniref:Uncharacterized protein n=1 Tax=Trichuris suis TaxID=68888 RepID=A0A085MMT8_9BILA|nr:hypothetical protein M513_00760 [Trichuris suis]KFD66092.1 hypothetical protein M514_00760 [Trichuris suis]
MKPKMLRIHYVCLTAQVADSHTSTLVNECECHDSVGESQDCDCKRSHPTFQYLLPSVDGVFTFVPFTLRRCIILYSSVLSVTVKVTGSCSYPVCHKVLPFEREKTRSKEHPVRVPGQKAGVQRFLQICILLAEVQHKFIEKCVTGCTP